jgi:hypothetical protein
MRVKISWGAMAHETFIEIDGKVDPLVYRAEVRGEVGALTEIILYKYVTKDDQIDIDMEMMEPKREKVTYIEKDINESNIREEGSVVEQNRNADVSKEIPI